MVLAMFTLKKSQGNLLHHQNFATRSFCTRISSHRSPLIHSRPILADPISMEYAMRSSYRSRVLEDRLAYGFKEKPINVPQKVEIAPDVPEEKLFDVNPGIIEFKRRRFESSESGEDDDDADQGRWEHSRPAKMPCGYSYNDLGYAESDTPEQEFVNVVRTTAAPPSRGIDCFGSVVDADEPDTKPHYFPAELPYSFAEYSEIMTR